MRTTGRRSAAVIFQECKTGAVSEYASIEQTMSPSALGMITDWILAIPEASAP